MAFNSLNGAAPADTAFIGNGASEIREIKTALNTTFPNVTGEITKPTDYGTAATTQPTASDFSLLFSDVLGLVAPSDTAESPILARGMVMSWFGDPTNATLIANLSDKGWKICNGATYTLAGGGGSYTVPDLQDRFIKCDNDAASGDEPTTAAQTVVTSSPYIVGTGLGLQTPKTLTKTTTVALTQANIPEHSHQIFADENADNNWAGPGENFGSPYVASVATDGSVDSEYWMTGSSKTPTLYSTSTYGNASVDPVSVNVGLSSTDFDHEHSISFTDVEPSHYRLAFICYVGSTA